MSTMGSRMESMNLGNRRMTTNISQRIASLTAGIGLLVMTILALFALVAIFQKILVPEDGAATVQNIVANIFLFRVGICSFLIVIICDIIVAWALYVFFAPVHQGLSLLTAWFRLVYAVIFAAALVNYVDIVQYLGSTGHLGAMDSAGVNMSVMRSINAFENGWSIGYVFFGLHLSFLGYLAYRSDYVPKILGILLVAAGVSYLIDYFGKIMVSGYTLNIAAFTGWGELIFMIWLLFKGGKSREAEAGT
jgi:hypothetical protein